MKYHVRCRRYDDNSYTLAYGRGSKKLTTTITRNGGKWRCPELDEAFPRKKDIVAAWGQWASEAYGTSGEKPAEAGARSESPYASTAHHSLNFASPKQEDWELGDCTPAEGDDLSEWQRGFCLLMSGKVGRLTQWEVDQFRGLLASLFGPGGRYTHEHVEESASNDSARPEDSESERPAPSRPPSFVRGDAAVRGTTKPQIPPVPRFRPGAA